MTDSLSVYATILKYALASHYFYPKFQRSSCMEGSRVWTLDPISTGPLTVDKAWIGMNTPAP